MYPLGLGSRTILCPLLLLLVTGWIVALELLLIDPAESVLNSPLNPADTLIKFPRPAEDVDDDAPIPLAPSGISFLKDPQVLYDGSFKSLKPISLGGLDEYFTAFESGRNYSRAENFAIGLQFRTMPRGTIWRKGTRWSYFTYGGPLISLNALWSIPARNEIVGGVPSITISLALDPPTKEKAQRIKNTRGNLTLTLINSTHSRRILHSAQEHLADLSLHSVVLRVLKGGAISVHLDGNPVFDIPEETSRVNPGIFAQPSSLARRNPKIVKAGLYFGATPDPMMCGDCQFPNCGIPKTFRGEISNAFFWKFGDGEWERGANYFKAGLKTKGTGPIQRPRTEALPLLAPQSSCAALGNRGNMKMDRSPWVLYAFGHLRTFSFTSGLEAQLCNRDVANDNPLLIVMVTPERTQTSPPEFGSALEELMPKSSRVVQDWWELMGRYYFHSNNISRCDGFVFATVSESSREAALRSIIEPIRNRFSFARKKYDQIDRIGHDSVFMMTTTMRLTAYRYHLLGETHRIGLERFEKFYKMSMPLNQLIVISRPDVQFRYSIPELQEIAMHLRHYPKDVFGFWDPFDFFDDRVLITTRQVVETIMKINHTCKWETTWLNSTSIFRMHVTDLSKEPEWGAVGPSVLWDFLLDLELAADNIYMLDSADFGDYFQYRFCHQTTALPCALQATRRAKKGISESSASEIPTACRNICKNRRMKNKHLNLSQILSARRLDWTFIEQNRRKAVVAKFPSIARANSKGYGYRRFKNHTRFKVLEKDFVVEKCLHI